MSDINNQITSEINNLKQQLEKNKQLLSSEKDIEMKSMIEEEISSLEKHINDLETTLNYADPSNWEQNNKKSNGLSETDLIDPNEVILEIRAGTGGDEAGLFAFDLYRMYMRYGEKVGWKFELLNLSDNLAGGIKTVTTVIKGKNIYALLKNESGVHRVQRVPTTEAGGRIHTSTATVAVLPEVKQAQINIRPEDIRMDFYRSGGHGGQNVNKVSTAVRLTHIPTGVVVECQEERSQLKNREKGMKILESRLYNMMQEQNVKNITDLRAQQVGTGERNEKIRTYNFPQDRITDHRVNKNWHNLETNMNGEIEDIITTLMAYQEPHQE
jgi:peptide chain release factor 1